VETPMRLIVGDRATVEWQGQCFPDATHAWRFPSVVSPRCGVEDRLESQSVRE
jgi:hypothetical protein